MFARLTSWFARHRQWKRDHIQAWAGWSDAEPGKLSRFQVESEMAIVAALSELGANLSGREVRPTSEGAFVCGLISPVGSDLWLHCDTIEVGNDKAYRRFEEWDYRTPQEMIQHAVRHIQEVLHARNLGAA